MRKVSVCLTAFLVAASVAAAQRAMPIPPLPALDPSAIAHVAEMEGMLSPSARTKLQQAAAAIAKDQAAPPQMVLDGVKTRIAASFPGTRLEEGVGSALAAYVLVLAVRAMDEDLTHLMRVAGEARALKDSAQKISSALASTRRSDAAVRAAQSCVEELENLAMTNLQERVNERSKALQLVSNLIASYDRTTSAIIRNLN